MCTYVHDKLRRHLTLSTSALVSTDDDDSLAIHLSTNLRTHSYKETAEEGVQQTFKLMRSQKQDWRDCSLPRNIRNGSRAWKINTLLQQDYIWELCQYLVRKESNHYVHSDIFKISGLHANLLSPYGGVSTTSVFVLT